MFRSSHFILAAVLFVGAVAQQPPAAPQSKPATEAAPATSQQAPPKAPVVDRRKLPLADRPNLSLADVNTDITVDKRVIVMMAALNLAGYDYESSNRASSAFRQQVRADLQGAKPELVAKLRNYFQSHRKGLTDAAAVAPYLSLALSLTEPPAFLVDVSADRLPEDVREITDFTLLLEEFYRETNFSRLLPKYVNEYVKVAQTYPTPAGIALGSVLVYLHTEPVLELPPLFMPRPSAASKPAKKEPEKKQDKKNKDSQTEKDRLAAEQKARLEEAEAQKVPNRVREFVIMPDLLNAAGAANLRVVRDTYFLLLGPASEPSIEAMRRSFLTFVLDPLIERRIKEVAAIRGDLRKLMEARGGKLDQDYAQRSAYFLVTDSLVRATDARMDVLGLAARRKSSEDEAIYDMSLGYERGAVLVYHFYDQIKAYEAVGVNVRDYVGDLLKNIDFEREGRRLDEYAQRLTRIKQLRMEATLAPAPPPTISNADEKLVARIIEADQLMKAKKYADAKTILEASLRERPNNARVLFGLAEVNSKQASAMGEGDPVEETLYAAVEFYKQAAQQASPESEKWLAQRSYVAAAKILDFIAEINPAVAERVVANATAAYELALKLGKVEGGAYDEAEKALKQRSQKPKP
ncbi:MAG: hypothetical protein JNJ50_13270 [Acidobacteria bacterium]|nr:hypothetical protein [Acidobacteriota bacterium]